MMKTDFAGCNGNEAQSCPQEKSKAARNAGAAEKANTELFEAIRKGDEKAFAEYYLKFIDNYVAFIRGIVLNEEEAREIAQDVFVYLWENRSELNPQKKSRSLPFRYG